MIPTQLLQRLINDWDSTRTNLTDFRKKALIFINAGADVTVENRSGESILKILMDNNKNCANNHVIKVLLQRNKSIKIRDKTPLQSLLEQHAYPTSDTVSDTFLKMALLLIKSGADVKATAKNGHTLLYFLLTRNTDGANNYVINELFKRHPALVNEKMNGETPLQKLLNQHAYPTSDTVSDTFRKMALLLIESDADVKATAKNGHTLLYFLLTRNTDGANNYVIKELFKRHPALVNEKMNGETPLQKLLNQHAYPHSDTVSEQFRKMALLLIESDADVTVTIEGKKSLLHFLLNRNNDGLNNQVIKKLLKRHPNLVKSEMSDQTPLQALLNENTDTIDKNFCDIVSILARFGADLSVVNRSKHTVFDVLTKNNMNGKYNKIIEQLLAYHSVRGSVNLSEINLGGDSEELNEDQKLNTIQEKKGYSVLEALLFQWSEGLCTLDDLKRRALLLAKDGVALTAKHPQTENTLLHILIENNEDGVNNAVIEQLLKLEPALMAIPDKVHRRTPLHILLRSNPKVSVDAFQDLAKVNQPLYDQDRNGETLLHAACFAGNLEVAQYLVDQGVELDAKTNTGLTVWHYATANQNCKLWQWLYDKEIDLNTQEIQKNHTPLHQAVLNKNAAMVAWLLQKNVNTSLKNNKNQTAAQLAKEERKNELAFLSPLSLYDLTNYPASIDQHIIYKKGLYDSIAAMSQYGQRLATDGVKKGQTLMDIAQELRDKADSFFVKEDLITEFPRFKCELTQLLHSKDVDLQKCRISWPTIFINVAIALSGVGALLLIAQLLHSKITENRALFFNQQPKTTAEQRIEKVEKALDGDAFHELDNQLVHMAFN